jgi:tetratricopeptide (TPR) repeat protein
MLRKLLAIAFLISLCAGVARTQESVKDLEAKLAQNPNDVAILVTLGRVCHSRGAAGDQDAVEKGFAYLDKALMIEPRNAVALAYRGSLWTQRGRDASDPLEKMGDVEKGVDDLDNAVEMAPDNVTVRLVRGVNSIQLPPMFNRLGTALKDFNHLLAIPELTKADNDLQATIYCWAGIAYKRDHQIGKSKELLEKAVKVAPTSEPARRAAKELKDLP